MPTNLMMCWWSNCFIITVKPKGRNNYLRSNETLHQIKILGQNHGFGPKIHLILMFQIMWFLWKCDFKNCGLLKCDFGQKWGIEILIFTKNAILKMWFLWKMRFWNWDFYEKCEFENVILHMWIFGIVIFCPIVC